jgi:hypothetical protein
MEDDPSAAWEATRRRVAAVLAEHLPPPRPGDREDNERAAEVIFRATSYTAGQYIVGNAEEERAKLGELIRCARDLSRIYASLDPRVRTTLWVRAYLMDPREAGMPNDRRVDLMDVHSLPDALARVLPRGVEHLKTMTPAGRTNWRAVTTVDHCRAFWMARTGAEAPSRGLNPESPFARFLADMLDALDVKANPVAAFAAWKRVETYAEDSA